MIRNLSKYDDPTTRKYFKYIVEHQGCIYNVSGHILLVIKVGGIYGGENND